MQLTRRTFLQFCSANLALPWIPSLFAAESPSSWSFGIIPDTQWANNMDAPFHGTAIHIIDAINAEFVRREVDFVIQVGDLVETPSAAAFQTRAVHNKTLAEAGIKFYPVRGNHDALNYDAVNPDENAMKKESAAQFAAAFPGLPGLPSCGGSSPDLPGAAGMTYSFTHKDGKFILLDTFPLINDGTKGGKAYTVGDYLPWIESELRRDDHRFALVFAHKNLLGQNHKDNLFGSHNDANPDMQNELMDCLQRNGVRYFISGHDHMYHHSRIQSPEGKSSVGQIICGSAAHKFYLPKPPFSERDKPIAQELNRIGFFIVRVENDRLGLEYYSTEPFGAEPQTPNWELQDSFGYTRDGQEFGEPTEKMKTFFRPEV
ncbi:MAG: metallophosphoesterase [Planctomycetaceae bacterium]|jgi:UDP-2,3-diacylglucosamine pyrophosphatase LpxH|nr:metallophosphoesterase [Planctomycetaceae bacterium]